MWPCSPGQRGGTQHTNCTPLCRQREVLSLFLLKFQHEALKPILGSSMFFTHKPTLPFAFAVHQKTGTRCSRAEVNTVCRACSLLLDNQRAGIGFYIFKRLLENMRHRPHVPIKLSIFTLWPYGKNLPTLNSKKHCLVECSMMMEMFYISAIQVVVTKLM